MRAPISSSARSSVLKNRRSRRLIACLTLLSGFLVLCAGLLPTNIGSLSTKASGSNTERAHKSMGAQSTPAGGMQKDDLQGNEPSARARSAASFAREQQPS